MYANKRGSIKQEVKEQLLLREWRKQQGWTIAELADLLGLEQSVLSRIERGERGLSMKGKVAVAWHLGVRVKDLFAPDPVPLPEADLASGDEATTEGPVANG